MLEGLKKLYPLQTENQPLAGLRKTSIGEWIDVRTGEKYSGTQRTLLDKPVNQVQYQPTSLKVGVGDVLKEIPSSVVKIGQKAGQKVIQKIKGIPEAIRTAPERYSVFEGTLKEGITLKPEKVTELAIGFMPMVGATNIAKSLVNTKTVSQATKILKQMGIADDLITKYAPKFAQTKDINVIQKGLQEIQKIPKVAKGVAPTISKEPQSLAQEAPELYKAAQKAGSAEEFYNKVVKVNDKLAGLPKLRTRELTIKQLPTEAERIIARVGKIIPETIEPTQKAKIIDFYNQAVKGVKEVKVSAEGLTPKVLPKVPPTISQLAKAKSIPEKMQISQPQLLRKVPQEFEELTSVQKITNALKEAKPIRGQQEKLYTQERGAKMAKALAVGEKTTGEAGFYRELGQLKGELPKVQFESIKNKISQVDVDNLFNQVKDSQSLNFWDKVSGRGGLVKLFEGRVPTEGELTLLGRIFPKEFIDTVLSKRSLFQKMTEAGYQLANVPRSVMASFDLSAPFRQGLFLISHPKRFFGSFTDMVKAFGSEKSFKAIQETIVKKPTFDLMRESKLALTEMDSILTLREEKFMSTWAEKIPIAGRIIRASGRAYTGFLNKLRADVFDDLIVKADKLGLTPRSSPDLVKEISNFVNVASGRGSIGALQPAAKALNSIFFSPRLMASRLTLLNPLYYIKANSFVRKEALKSLLTVLGVGSSILGLSKLAGAEVGTDPRSADFGKIIVGKTRLDVWGGFQQYIRMFGQVFSGQYVSSVTGKLVTLGEGYKPLTRLDIIVRQIEAKEAPIMSLITALLKGQNFRGEKISIPKEIGNRFVPMAIQDIYEIYKNEPDLLPISGLGMFGFGLQTYSEKKGQKLPTEAEKKDVYEISKILGEQATQREELSNASSLMYQKLKELPKEQAAEEFDRLTKENPQMAEKINDLIKDDQLGLSYLEKIIKQLGVENGERAKYIKSKLDKLKTKEEKAKYYQNLIDKKVITKQVNEQLLKLLKD